MQDGSTIKMTADEFLAIPPDGKLYELIDGELIVNPAPVPWHQKVIFNIVMQLGPFVKERHLGRVYFAPIDVKLTVHDVFEPDIIYISRERLRVIGPKFLTEAPDLAVEVVSKWSHRRDEVVKRRVYERAGVREYWVVDPMRLTVNVYRREGDAFARGKLLDRQDALSTPLLPGFALPLREVFAEE
jgi:Uma2 family endonuclease